MNRVNGELGLSPTTLNSNSIAGAQSTVNGAKPDYRFSMVAGSVWRYQLDATDRQPVSACAAGLRAQDLDDSTGPNFQFIFDYEFSVTDGERTYMISVTDADPATPDLNNGDSQGQILTFVNDIPPPDTDLLVVDPVMFASKTTIHKDPRARIICFTPGTWIRTPIGPKLVELLEVDDLVLTKDNGVRPIRWIGQRRMTGARLIAMPDMRPIRIRCGALGANVPDRDIWVSPRHRMLLQGPTAQVLFNTPEVLIAAKDLVNDRTITVDRQITQTEYIHLLFDQHEIIWANGAQTESFHPGHALTSAVQAKQLQELYQIFPDLEADPYGFSQPARRLLSSRDAAAFLSDFSR